MAQSVAPSNPFIKQLAANDRQVRDRALSSLRTFLTRKTPFTATDFLKLWKGLFYTMWSQDKPQPQRRLALDLADLVTLLPTPANFLTFMDAFWETMRREWPGVDNLRMDKFLFLVRQYVNAGFAYVARDGWKDTETRGKYLDVLRKVPLNPRDPKVPNGLRFHVVDVFVDEVEKVAGEGAPYDELLGVLREVQEKTQVKSLRVRVKDALDDDRVREWMGEEKEGEDGEEEDSEEEEADGEWGGFDD